MGKERIQEKYDRYVDAMVELYMECYGDMLTEEISKDIQSMEDQKTEVPPELTKQCIRKINKEFAKSRRMHALKRAGKVLRAVAALAIVVLALSSVLFVSVEAVRVPVINYYIKQGKGHWTFTSSVEEEQSAEVESHNTEDPLRGIIPEEYELVELSGQSFERMAAVYRDQDGNHITFRSQPIKAASSYDTENAEIVENRTIMDMDVVYILKNAETSYAWLHEESEILYSLSFEGLLDTEAEETMGKLIQLILG